MGEDKAPETLIVQSRSLAGYGALDIPPGSFFSESVYLDEKFILATPEMPITLEMIKALSEWDFSSLYSAGSPMEEYSAPIEGDAEEGEIPGFSILGESDKFKVAQEFYAGLVKDTEFLYAQAALSNRLDFDAVAAKIKTTCNMIRESQRFLLRVQKNSHSSSGGNYLASHAVKSAIISIIIGYYLKLAPHRLIELGVAALLHEIGMARLPPKIYLTNRPLQNNERKAILSHPALSYNLLRAHDFPLAVATAAMEHHERENGTGYPRRLSGDKISLYGKIIAVACSYEALAAHRPHKEAKDDYTGMVELLKNEGKQYDNTIIRALVFSLSIYPIGLYVLLSSGRKGQVIDINPENPRYPFVQVFGELSLDGKNKILETSQEGVSIVRPLTREEIKWN